LNESVILPHGWDAADATTDSFKDGDRHESQLRWAMRHDPLTGRVDRAGQCAVVGERGDGGLGQGVDRVRPMSSLRQTAERGRLDAARAARLFAV